MRGRARSAPCASPSSGALASPPTDATKKSPPCTRWSMTSRTFHDAHGVCLSRSSSVRLAVTCLKAATARSYGAVASDMSVACLQPPAAAFDQARCAAPDSQRSCIRARRRPPWVSHHRSSAGQGPAHPVTRSTPWGPTTVDGRSRHLTATADPHHGAAGVEHVERDGIVEHQRRRGRRNATRPRARRRAPRRRARESPHGIICTCSPGPASADEHRSGRALRDRAGLARAAMARVTRSLASLAPPHRLCAVPLCSCTSSGANRSSVIPAVGTSSSTACATSVSQPSACQRTRSATAAASSAPSDRQRRSRCSP